jgi:hypothetical protein
MPSDENPIASPSTNTSFCPPEDDRAFRRREEMDDSSEGAIVALPEILQQPTPPASGPQDHGSTESDIIERPTIKRMDIDEETTSGPDMLSPMSADTDNKPEESELPALTSTDPSPSMGYDFSNVRVRLLSISLDLQSRSLTGL